MMAPQSHATALNGLFAAVYARSKDSPAKVWWHARAMHPAIFRALHMDKGEIGAVYAAAAFRLNVDDDGARILCAFPAPRIIDAGDDDWLGIHTVLSWNPVDDTAEVMGEPGPAIVGAIPDSALNIHASPYAFLRSLAEERAQWFVQRQSMRSDWHSLREPDLTPGLLLIGEPDKVRWPTHRLPDDITLHGIDARAFNTALIRQARIPRARSAPTDFRKVA